jgi:predicted Holliday junction resolvase-like endonuclease
MKNKGGLLIFIIILILAIIAVVITRLQKPLPIPVETNQIEMENNANNSEEDKSIPENMEISNNDSLDTIEKELNQISIPEEDFTDME